MTLTAEKNSLTRLRRWLPGTTPLRVLDIGCGTAEEAGPLLNASSVAEFVGVDLDEMAITQARARWPQATFLCADAARLPAEYKGHFHVALIRRPDLFAQPERWRQVFAALLTLLQPAGRVIATLIGEGEALVAREWLQANGLRVIHAEELPQPDESRLLVAEVPPDSSQPAPPLMLIQLDDDAGEGMYCDSLTGECFLPAQEIRPHD